MSASLPLRDLGARLFRLVVSVLAVVVCMAGTACKSDEERFAEHLARGEEYAAEGQRSEAILEFSSALNIDPTNAEINEQIALLLSRQGAVENAARHFIEAFNLDPTRIGAAMHHAQLVAWTNRQRSDELVAMALKRAPDQPIVQRTVAALAIIDGDTEKALVAAQRAIELDPKDPENWIQLGRSHLGQVNQARATKKPVPEFVFSNAIDAFNRVDELRGGDVAIKLERARVYRAWKPRSAETLAAYEDALAFAAKSGDKEEQMLATRAAAEFAKSVGNPQLEERALRASIEITPGWTDGWRDLANLKGESVLKELLKKRPDDPRAHRLYVSWSMSQGRSREAIAHLTKVLGDGLDSPALWDELIRQRLQRGQIKPALEALEELEDRYEGDPNTQRALARVAMSQRRNGKAVDLLRGSAATTRSPESQRLLALAEFRRGNFDEAKTAIDRSLTLSEELSPESLRLKARIHHSAKEWGLALRTFFRMTEEGLAFSPEEKLMVARTHYERGQRLAGQKQLLELLGNADVSPAVSVEFARREGDGQPKVAMLHLRKAQEQAPGNIKLLRAMVTIDRSTGRMGRALERVDEAVGAGHGGPFALLLRAQLLADLDFLERAENDALRAFEAAPSLPGAVDLLLEIYREQGKLTEAQRSFDEAEAAGVLHAGARRLLGRLYDEQGKTDDAIGMLEKVIDRNPRMAGARRDLALILARQGKDLERALVLAREANAALKGDARSASALGYAFYRKGLNEAALREYRRAISLDRDAGRRMAPSLRYHLGLTLRAMDRNEQAAKAFAAALELSPDFPEAEDARRQLKATQETS